MKKINEEGIERDTPFDGGNLEGQKEMFDIDQMVREPVVLQKLESFRGLIRNKGEEFSDKITEMIRRNVISAIVLAAKEAHVDLQAIDLPEGYESISTFVEETDLFLGLAEILSKDLLDGISTNLYYPLD
jgi:hypothetical protein